MGTSWWESGGWEVILLVTSFEKCVQVLSPPFECFQIGELRSWWPGHPSSLSGAQQDLFSNRLSKVHACVLNSSVLSDSL